MIPIVWRTAFLLAALLCAGCLGDRTEMGKIPPDGAPVMDLSHVPPAHLRVQDEATGMLLFSTWVGEKGPLQRNTSAGNPLDLVNESEMPRYLRPLFDLWRTGLPGTHFTLSGYRIPKEPHDVLRLPRQVEVASHGTIDAKVAEEFFHGAKPPGNYSLAGVLPFQIVAWNDTVEYQFNVEANSSFPVYRTRGLQVMANLTEDFNNLLFTLTSPTGGFESLGCRVSPGLVLPPGYFEILDATPTEWTVASYADRQEKALEDRVVRIELTFRDNDQANETR